MGANGKPARDRTYPAWSPASLEAMIRKAERLCERHRAEAADPRPVHGLVRRRALARLRVMEAHLERLRALQASRAGAEGRQGARSPAGQPWLPRGSGGVAVWRDVTRQLPAWRHRLFAHRPTRVSRGAAPIGAIPGAGNIPAGRLSVRQGACPA
jgi:hypothetical protein